MPNPNIAKKPIKVGMDLLTGLIVAAPILVTLWLVLLLIKCQYIAPTLRTGSLFQFAGEPMRGWIQTIVQLLSVGVGAAGISSSASS